MLWTVERVFSFYAIWSEKQQIQCQSVSQWGHFLYISAFNVYVYLFMYVCFSSPCVSCGCWKLATVFPSVLCGTQHRQPCLPTEQLKEQIHLNNSENYGHKQTTSPCHVLKCFSIYKPGWQAAFPVYCRTAFCILHMFPHISVNTPPPFEHSI